MDITSIILSVPRADNVAEAARLIAKESKKTDFPIEVDAVYKWPRNGIPDHHWPVMIKLTGTSVDALYAANQALRRSKLKGTRPKTGVPRTTPEHQSTITRAA